MPVLMPELKAKAGPRFLLMNLTTPSVDSIHESGKSFSAVKDPEWVG